MFTCTLAALKKYSEKKETEERKGYSRGLQS